MPSDHHETIARFLCSCRELMRLTGQHGWVDGDTLTFEVIEDRPEAAIVAVSFVEVVTEAGSGAQAERLVRSGRLRLHFDEAGEVVRCELA
jgi:hypothetical protein